MPNSLLEATQVQLSFTYGLFCSKITPNALEKQGIFRNPNTEAWNSGGPNYMGLERAIKPKDKYWLAIECKMDERPIERKKKDWMLSDLHTTLEYKSGLVRNISHLFITQNSQSIARVPNNIAQTDLLSECHLDGQNMWHLVTALLITELP